MHHGLLGTFLRCFFGLVQVFTYYGSHKISIELGNFAPMLRLCRSSVYLVTWLEHCIKQLAKHILTVKLPVKPRDSFEASLQSLSVTLLS